MPFTLYLKNSIQYEQTHKVILQSLLVEPSFMLGLFGIDMPTGSYIVKSEPVKGLFDLGIFKKDGECVLLVELKMWSGLSDGQLARQADYLQEMNCSGCHLLLGTANLQFSRTETSDQISKLTFGKSYKIGYVQLIHALKSFGAKYTGENTLGKMAIDYANELQLQANFLENAWLRPEFHPHHRFHSLYGQMKNYLQDDKFRIYRVENRAGGSVILNNSQSWKSFIFKGASFQIYQEFLDGKLMIRTLAESANIELKQAFKSAFLKQFSKYKQSELAWDTNRKISPYHKLAVLSPELETQEQLLGACELFQSLELICSDIVHQLENEFYG